MKQGEIYDYATMHHNEFHEYIFRSQRTSPWPQGHIDSFALHRPIVHGWAISDAACYIRGLAVTGAIDIKRDNTRRGQEPHQGRQS